MDDTGEVRGHTNDQIDLTIRVLLTGNRDPLRDPVCSTYGSGIGVLRVNLSSHFERTSCAFRFSGKYRIHRQWYFWRLFRSSKGNNRSEMQCITQSEYRRIQ